VKGHLFKVLDRNKQTQFVIM